MFFRSQRSLASTRAGSFGWMCAVTLVCSISSTATVTAQTTAEPGNAAGVSPGPATARLKPLSRVAKPAVGETDRASSALTTGSVAKMAAGTAPAPAAKAAGRCTRLAFEVNDYGKDGPTKDAKSLLDKHIASWAAEKGIKRYTVGKKTVNCRLFLDLIVFDEHTCRAEAPVCW